jgi:hypothetical protein
MTHVEASPAGRFGGRYETESGPVCVTIRTCGEAYEVVSLEAAEPAAVAVAADTPAAHAALFTAPRAGADRYPDWALFEWTTRLGREPEHPLRVWRIAEDRNWAVFLGQCVESDYAGISFPLPAALWCAWGRKQAAGPRALFWQSSRAGHLWITDPFNLPTYARLGADTQPDALVFALAQYADPRSVVLEVGGISPEYNLALTRIFPGRIRPTEPFADYLVAPALREQIVGLTDPTACLPALGAARALAHGPPPVLSLCASSPAVTADGV